ncbi:Uncharacterised protein [Bordetella pertussis]|nr:Uncharacterised protein [Bordetella pertussis]
MSTVDDSLGCATKLPTPRLRSTRPSNTSCWIACTTVARVVA